LEIFGQNSATTAELQWENFKYGLVDLCVKYLIWVVMWLMK